MLIENINKNNFKKILLLTLLRAACILDSFASNKVSLYFLI